MQNDTKLSLRNYFGVSSISITGLAKADEILKEYSATCTPKGVYHSFSKFSIRLSEAEKSVVVSLEIHGSGFSQKKTFKRYIKDESKLRVAVCYYYNKGLHISSDRQRVEEIVSKIEVQAEKLRNSKKFVSDVEKQEAKNGKVSDYFSMTYDEALQWLAWLNDWKKKNPRITARLLNAGK